MGTSSPQRERVVDRRATRNRRRRHRRIAAFVAVSVAAFGGAAAFAAWTVGGGGSGTATAVSAQNLTTGTAATTAALLPGHLGRGNLSLSVNNPNPFPVTITSVNADGAAVPDATHASGCVTTGCGVRDHGHQQSDSRERVVVVHGRRRIDVERLRHRMSGRDVHHSGLVQRDELTQGRRQRVNSMRGTWRVALTIVVAALAIQWAAPSARAAWSPGSIASGRSSALTVGPPVAAAASAKSSSSVDITGRRPDRQVRRHRSTSCDAPRSTTTPVCTVDRSTFTCRDNGLTWPPTYTYTVEGVYRELELG